MSRRLLTIAGMLIAVGHAQVWTAAVPEPLPIRNGRPVVAVVNHDAISLDEFAAEVGDGVNRTRLGQGRGTRDELALLDRLITIKLIVQEAKTMGIDALPEVQKQVEVTSREILREVLIARLVKDVRPKPADIERLYRESVREWKTVSLLFQDEAAAKRARADLAGGAPFDAVAKKVTDGKAGRAERDDTFHARKDYLPQVAEAVSALKVGQISQVIRLQSGFTVIKVIDVRYPENREARAAARKSALEQEQQVVLKAHGESLKKQYATVDAAALKGLNFETSGMSALLKDTRVLARIKGGPSITAADLADYLRLQFFHGSDNPKQGREMNQRKDVAFEAMLGRRLLNLEAQRLGIDKTNAYRDRVRGYQESLVFNTFIDKVIAPENKMKEDEVRRYYTDHARDYSYPEMVKVRSLAFTRTEAAERAAKKIREGTDFGWVAANAEEQAGKSTPGLLAFDGQPVMKDAMPEGVRKALAGAKSGDLRVYATPGGPVYVFAVQQVISPGAKPYDDVREEIAKKLYGEKLQKGIESYAGKLRAQSKVATYLKKV